MLFSAGWQLAPAQTAGKTAKSSSVEFGPTSDVKLVAPNATESVRNRSEVIGWPAGRKPVAPAGFEVTLFADDVDTPRWATSLPNGDILVALSLRGGNPGVSSTSNRIILFRDKDGDGRPESRNVLLTNLNRPHGILLLGDFLYIGNTDAVVRYKYQLGQTEITTPGEKILDLPPGGHYTRNLIANADGTKIYVAVGSKTNVDESGEDAKDPRRAAILEINSDGSGMRVYASGLRNPVGLAWESESKQLWTVVNERDALGDQLVPDYATSVKEGAFYGWPYSYYGQNEDPRKKGQRPDLVAKAIPPDYATGAHTGTLGITFYTGKQYPAKYQGGAFIGQHGSWNRSKYVGYRIAYLPFKNGKPAGPMEDFLTGFIANDKEVYGRPVVATLLQNGALLVIDDESSKVWHVRYTGK
ncbi:MAG: sorbosone dehydrogenase family protein [Acidobacteria bacterium]|nr:sorbosone dehydrogenase family protein [Acidobacteriota bacterium]